jgi:hypothetical protein
MTHARGRVVLILAAALAAVLALAIAARRDGPGPLPPRPIEQRPTLLLLTSLPLLFGENFSLKQTGSPVLKALETRYRLVPISTTNPAELAKGSLLLMAHPLGQAPEDLVGLDEWVRHGGRVLLLADPMLEWPSELPLGDPLRPPPVFVDTGLLGHWGLRLDGPRERGPRIEELGGYRVLTVSPGALSGRCSISTDRLLAHCRVGKGRATVVADADLLDSARLGPDARHNLDAIVAELAGVEHP